MWLIRNKYFWFSTILFLIIGVGGIWLVFPQLLQQRQDISDQMATIDSQIAAATQRQAAIRALNSNEAQVDALYQTASLALPVTTDAENLTLQLHGLLDSLKLTSAVITAPFQQTAAVAAPTASSSTTTTPTPSSQTSTGPVAQTNTAANSTQGTFTISGEMDFATAQVLIADLRMMTRWNRLTGIEISQSGGKTTVLITAQVYARKAPATAFNSTDLTFLNKAAKVFGSLKAYATAPDVTKEGSYGRANPFANL